MTQKQAEEAWTEKRINVFDLTHIWPHKDYPLRDIGKMVLDENPAVCFCIPTYSIFSTVTPVLFCSISSMSSMLHALLASFPP